MTHHTLVTDRGRRFSMAFGDRKPQFWRMLDSVAECGRSAYLTHETRQVSAEADQ